METSWIVFIAFAVIVMITLVILFEFFTKVKKDSESHNNSNWNVDDDYKELFKKIQSYIIINKNLRPWELILKKNIYGDYVLKTNYWNDRIEIFLNDDWEFFKIKTNNRVYFRDLELYSYLFEKIWFQETINDVFNELVNNKLENNKNKNSFEEQLF